MNRLEDTICPLDKEGSFTYANEYKEDLCLRKESGVPMLFLRAGKTSICSSYLSAARCCRHVI